MVTPLAGVWIEIIMTAPSRRPQRSRLSQACGLKFSCQKALDLWKRSRLSQACGLKFSKLHPLKQLALVTPLAGVWIEIPYGMRIAEHGRSRLSQACG